MDTIYGTKKYFQSLSGASDAYRSSACRPLHTQMSYQATLGRRPAFGAYHHMNNQPPAPAVKAYGLNTGYNLNTWTMGREGKSLAPSIYSNTTKFGRHATTSRHQHHHRKSFSIILTTAAFILLLAVITVAALAYYISSIRMHIDDSMLGFEGSFQISKGDAFSRGLKYNHTTTYKQKTEFYKRFLERALTDNGLVPLHTEINGFGEGPLIQVNFKTIIDVRKLPQNENGVEDLIKECIFLETVAEKSLYRYLKIDLESIEVKRFFNDLSSKSAFDSAEKMVNPNDRRFLKKSNKNYLNLVSRPETTTPKNILRTTTHENEEIDNIDAKIENAPVVHGSFEGFFEITKTDADITHTKVSPTKAYSTLPAKAITPHFLRVRNKKPAIEKVNIKSQHDTTTKATSKTKAITTTSTTLKTTKATTKSTTTTTTSAPKTTTTIKQIKTTVSLKTEETVVTKPSVQSKSTTTMPTTKMTQPPAFFNHMQHQTLPLSTTTAKPPFTSFPILDTQPWKPIHREELLPGPPPAFPTKTLAFNLEKVVLNNVSESLNDKLSKIRPFEKSSDSSYKYDYSFNRFAHLPYMDIERLGAGAQIQPHPLPISLIDEVIPSFRPINFTEANNKKETTENTTTQDKNVETTPKQDFIELKRTPLENYTETADEKFIGDENNLSKSNNNVIIESELEVENSTVTTKKPYLWNMREVILKRTQLILNKNDTDKHDDPNLIVDTNQRNSTNNKKNIANKIPITLDDSFLFPSHSKWQFVNSSNYNKNNYSSMSNLRKVFNKTLQALVSEDIKENMTTLNEIKTRINNITNLQDISHIFDTLASKLGVTPTISTKMPPVSENKLKQQTTQETLDNLTKRQQQVQFENLTPSRAPEVFEENQEERREALTTVNLVKPTVSSFIEMRLKQREELHDENSSSVEGIGAAIPVFGEADVEHMDPTKYEELLRSTNFAETSLSSRESLPELVTLMPVRSNSAIRIVSQ